MTADGVRVSGPHTETAAWGTQLRDLASLIDSMGQAMEEGDDILGAISGQGIANHLCALPKHIRDVFMEHLCDEAADAFKAEQRYYEWEASRG